MPFYGIEPKMTGDNVLFWNSYLEGGTKILSSLACRGGVIFCVFRRTETNARARRARGEECVKLQAISSQAHKRVSWYLYGVLFYNV